MVSEVQDFQVYHFYSDLNLSVEDGDYFAGSVHHVDVAVILLPWVAEKSYFLNHDVAKEASVRNLATVTPTAPCQVHSRHDLETTKKKQI